MLGVSPHEPGTVFAGLRPGGMLRTIDGGATWDELPIGVAPECSVGSTRLLTLSFNQTAAELCK